jgi:hypothetical protein
MSEISTARTKLHASLIAYTADLLEADRIHLYTPTQIASPCLWIGQPGVSAQQQGNPGTRIRIVRFGVYALADGYDPEQCALLDELVARIWDAAHAVQFADAINSVAQSIDIGGTSQRGVVTDVGIQTYAASLCPRPPLASLAPALA